ncbi:type IV pili twitching motility protein PilT [Candidatus Gottesmanbacteria bacterium RIFCSPHIGHO2_01_FULL_46_14]|uniref:Type IV pili twitching motility protein PilT n=3 Tax=Candidatus Gottesmaniibacteriota TaxID=1752720 RepID=A0A1F5ZS96_9BACT|nr:MAG: twitching motility protein [Candidatus Gottesmanbacteria bacterium GW2011_GWA1_47_8]OGG14977.1 MAG: type IV pili twitching motility protein PilT [Candidatus Gottesmanbacteria bacterium RIFCSPHIGHO2_01_FULL_46_14]OGG30052.1 MAG: type IV pili twitching motility protein PilT [Candidatus Gottesmanbacteria bacterium RIFCSPLOWO2_01_FULL_46_21]
MNIQEIFSEAARLEASDIHLNVGFPPILRIGGALRYIDGTTPLTPQLSSELALATMTQEQRDLFQTNREIDYSVQSAVGRLRANVFYQKNTVAAAFRLISTKIRSIDELGLPTICHEFVKLRQGLVLVTGPTGHGKSTTLAAMINNINTSRAMHIITVEDPVEYIFPISLSIVSQREMHQDTHSWNVALRSILREDPNVVLVGEMRDLETISAALTIAETGHLVFATLHTNSAAQTMDRIIDVFPETQQAQIRLQLASVLEGVLSQRLVPAVGGGRVAVAEVLTGTPAVRSTIRDGKTHLLDNIIQTSLELGMMTLEGALSRAVKEGRISVETASSYAIRPEELGRLMRI